MPYTQTSNCNIKKSNRRFLHEIIDHAVFDRVTHKFSLLLPRQARSLFRGSVFLASFSFRFRIRFANARLRRPQVASSTSVRPAPTRLQTPVRRNVTHRPEICNMLASSNRDTSVNYIKRKSFTVLPVDVSTRHERANGDPHKNLTSTAKVTSVYHQNCLVPNENFSIEHRAIGCKNTQPTAALPAQPSVKLNFYAPSKEFFARVSSKLKTLRCRANATVTEESPRPQPDKKIMEKPKFITTVKSGAFLEPPPELAVLLGLRKSGFAGGPITSSSTAVRFNGLTQTANHRPNGMYSFSSKPRLVKSNFVANTPPPRNWLSKGEIREKREISDHVDKQP